MDLQKLVDSMNRVGRSIRSEYHLTLGQAIEALEAVNPNYAVTFDYDENLSPSAPHSYRGYYSDLSLEPSTARANVSDVLTMLESARGQTFEGYKGGDFPMNDDTPLWAASYGTTGRAIIGLNLEGRGAVFATKNVD